MASVVNATLGAGAGRALNLIDQEKTSEQLTLTRVLHLEHKKN